MKKAILISGIIWAVASIVLAIVFVSMGGLSLTAMGTQEGQKVINDFAAQNNVTVEAAKAALTVSATALVVAGIWLFVAAAYSFVLVGLRNKQTGKGAGIALGIVGIVLGAELPGIFTIIDAAKNR